MAKPVHEVVPRRRGAKAPGPRPSTRPRAWEIPEKRPQPCFRELRIAQRVKEQATWLRNAHNASIPGVDYRLEDAQSYAESALLAAHEGRCALARVDLKFALKQWRRARRKAGV